MIVRRRVAVVSYIKSFFSVLHELLCNRLTDIQHALFLNFTLDMGKLSAR